MNLGQQWDLDVYAGPHTSSEVRGTSQNIAQVLVPHVLPALLPDLLLHLENQCYNLEPFVQTSG